MATRDCLTACERNNAPYESCHETQKFAGSEIVTQELYCTSLTTGTAMRLRYRISDLLFLTTLLAMMLGWLFDHQSAHRLTIDLQAKTKQLEIDRQQLENDCQMLTGKVNELREKVREQEIKLFGADPFAGRIAPRASVPTPSVQSDER